MIEHRHSIAISCPPDDIFAFITDPANLGAWRLDLARYEILTPGTFAKGTRWREYGVPLGGRAIVGDIEIIDFEAGKYFTIRSTIDNTPFETVYNVEPVDGGTCLSFHLTGKLPGLLKMLEPVIKRRIVSMTEMNFDNVKRLLESEGSP